MPVICNYEARVVSTPDEIRSTLERQVTGSVQWEASMRELLARGLDTFVELGPDSALKNFMARIDKSAMTLSIGDASTLETAVAALSV